MVELKIIWDNSSLSLFLVRMRHHERGNLSTSVAFEGVSHFCRIFRCRGRPHQRILLSDIKGIDFSYGVRIRAEYSLILSRCTHEIDARRDGQNSHSKTMLRIVALQKCYTENANKMISKVTNKEFHTAVLLWSSCETSPYRCKQGANLMSRINRHLDKP